MSLIGWSPFRDLDDFVNRVNTLAGRSLLTGEEGGRGGSVIEWRPVANIAETDSAYLIKAELPGVDKNDVEVSVHDGIITIKGERRVEKHDQTEKHHRVESFYGTFSRSFSLPSDADETRIEAEARDGVLTVRIPKTEAAKPRAIDIKVR